MSNEPIDRVYHHHHHHREHHPMSGESAEATGLASDNDHRYMITQLLKHARPGEMLEFTRGSFVQYAIYLGDGKAMHIEPEDKEAEEARVRDRSVRDLCDDVRVRIIKNHDSLAMNHFQVEPRPANDIVQTAISYANKMVPYEHEFRNCEYYCTLWRYGHGFSSRAAKHAATGCWIGCRLYDY